MYPVGMFARLTIAVCALVWAALPSSALATEVAQKQVAPEKRLFRGSSVSYRHTATTRTFDKAYENTWNPYYAQTVVLSPMVWLGDDINLSANALFTREFTESDVTTEEDETLMGDVSLSVSAPRVEPASPWAWSRSFSCWRSSISERSSSRSCRSRSSRARVESSLQESSSIPASR